MTIYAVSFVILALAGCVGYLLYAAYGKGKIEREIIEKRLEVDHAKVALKQDGIVAASDADIMRKSLSTALRAKRDS